jgi:hypothetical protein
MPNINFDYVRDSFVEAANNHIKKGALKVDSPMDMSNSGYTQLKDMDALTLKKDCDMVKNINSKKDGSISTICIRKNQLKNTKKHQRVLEIH